MDLGDRFVVFKKELQKIACKFGKIAVFSPDQVDAVIDSFFISQEGKDVEVLRLDLGAACNAALLYTAQAAAAAELPMDPTVMKPWINSEVIGIVTQDDAPGGVITWNAKEQRYREYYSEQFGWQSIETRGVVVVETEQGGLVAIVPVGMCQVSSVNFEDTVKVGAKVKKGDPLGYFLFGGSDIVMIFSEDLNFELTTKPQEHILMGNSYGTISAGK